jgi:PAS domain S-box-containing protein
MPGIAHEARLFVVVLQEAAPAPSADAEDGPPRSADRAVVEQLSAELRATRAHLQSAVEELASANEDLKSSNEELISTNEELQSANEELSTSKEELQSVNEELETVNTELQESVHALAAANDDLRNLYASSEIATIFLDQDLCISRFTPAAAKLLRLIDADAGRSIADLASRFEGQNLLADAEETLAKGALVERQVRSAEGIWFVKRVRPYRTSGDRIAGVSVTFIDVTELKRVEARLRLAEAEARRRAAELSAVFEALEDPMIVFDGEGTVVGSNAAARAVFGADPIGVDRDGWERLLLSHDTCHADGRAVEVVELPCHRARRGERVRAIVHRMRDASGRDAVYEKSGVPLVVDGRILGAAVAWRDVSARTRAEAELRDSEERFRALAETMPQLVWMSDAEGAVLYLNRRWGAFTGIEAPTDEERRRAIHPDDLPRVTAEWADAVARERPFEIEMRMRGRDGAYRWLLARAVAVHDESGHTLRWIGTATDIDDAKRVQDEARRTADQLRLALASGRLGTWDFDVLAGDVRGDPRFRAIFDVRGGSLRIDTVLDRIHGDDRPRVEEAIRRALDPADPASYDVEYRVVRGDGAVRWVVAKGQAYFEGEAPARRAVRFVGTLMDITEQKATESAREKVRQGLQGLLDTSIRVVRETSIDGVLRVVSDAALGLTGARLAVCGHGQIAGQFRVGCASRAPGMPLCPAEQLFLSGRGGVYDELVGGGESIRLDDEALRAHPRWQGLPTGHAPLRGLLGVRLVRHDGSTNGVILASDKDVGDFTAEDETLLKQLGAIASLAVEHIEARLRLEEADQNKNRFLAMLSHELRNPLAPIRSSLVLLERAAPGAAQARRAQEIIGRQVAHMTHLVDDLLDVNRISSGKIQLRFERVDLRDVVARTAEDLRALFTAGGVVLSVALGGEPLFVRGDRTRLAQVVGNLLQNAAKFTSQGGKAAISVERQGQAAVVRVRDDGAGIEASMLDHLFEPFAQSDTTLDRSRGGLGLGLALVRGLVEMHGGQATARSDGLGCGAEFEVRVPLDAGASAPAVEPPPPVDAPASRRVLIIEDNYDAAESLRDVLELDGHSVETAPDGPDGLAIARRFAPEIVLCDIGLPGMDGFEVARAIRADAALRATFLVALTGYATPEDVARAREAGFDTHLAKPPSIDAVERLVARAPAAGARGA